MKSSFLTLAFLLIGFGSTSLAELSANSDWHEIMSNNKVVAGFPSIPFQNGSFFALDQVCIDGARIYPLKKYNTICTKFQEDGDSVRCARTRSIELYSPVIAQQKVCLEFTEGGTCTKMVMREIDYSRTYKIGVYSVEGEGGMGGQPLFTKDYRIEECAAKDLKDTKDSKEDEKESDKSKNESQTEMSNE